MQHQFPPGYRFYPTDQQLLTCFLDKKIKNQPVPPNKAVKDFDIYTQDPWDIWRAFCGDYLGDKIDQDQGLFFLTELKKVSDKKQGSNFSRSVPSGRWHGDTARDPITDSRGSTIGFKKYFIYRNKKTTINGHDGKWKMHEITSLIDPSSNYVLCQLQKNDKDKRKNSGSETKTGATVSCDDGVHVQKRQKFSSETNQQGESEQSRFYEPEENTVCATAETDFENPIGSSIAMTDFTDEGVSLDELMSILNEETDASVMLETDPKHVIEDSNVTESGKTQITETEVRTSHASLEVEMGSNHVDAVGMNEETDTFTLLETDPKNIIEDSKVTEFLEAEVTETKVLTSHASLAVDMGSNHVEAVGMYKGLAEACLPVSSHDSKGDFFADLKKLFADDPQFASPFLVPWSDSMLPGFYNASWADF